MHDNGGCISLNSNFCCSNNYLKVCLKGKKSALNEVENLKVI